ncbi:hypothetical protein J6590_062292 [Homalodisca vitripennis]|nr:hypothetical protein J6590_062292 [Homalodisca vitripennis]
MSTTNKPDITSISACRRGREFPVGTFLHKRNETIEEYFINHKEFYINREDPQTPFNRVDKGIERAPLTSLNNGAGDENLAKLDLESQNSSSLPPEILNFPKIPNFLGFTQMKKHKWKPQQRRISVNRSRRKREA